MWPLVVTSALFMIPAVKRRKKNKILSSVNAVTSIVSMNYWRNPTPGLRRSIDFSVAKCNFVLHHLYANPKYFPFDLIIIPCWWMSKQKGSCWVIWHGLFHISSTVGMICVQ
jgi:hypothetical protein